jgi:uncharacterized UBP type Zn finger protein
LDKKENMGESLDFFFNNKPVSFRCKGCKAMVKGIRNISIVNRPQILAICMIDGEFDLSIKV